MFSFLFNVILELLKAILFWLFWFFLIVGIILLSVIIIGNIYDKFKGNKEEKYVLKPKYIEKGDYQYIFEIVEILTEFDEKILNEVKSIVINTEQFEGELTYGIDYFICMKLSDYSDEDNGFTYGARLDWKETIQNGVESLNDTIAFKNYDIDLSNMNYFEDGSIEDLLYKGNQLLSNYGFSLVQWDMGSDEYHLFIIKETNLNKLIKLGDKFAINFRIKLANDAQH